MFSGGNDQCKSCHRPDHVFLFREIDEKIILANEDAKNLTSIQTQDDILTQVTQIQQRLLTSNISFEPLPDEVLRRVVQAQIGIFNSSGRTATTPWGELIPD
ncbi:MAG: hypothetical protein A3I05_01950 [Deltaproteobacteria bacterium RIFCSPLOWO2_02_FULL_44_10]|nr:MAG: hypothetical protein A3C46_08120 [Deltaproteobacteria bacterium RIFCSPHIGHO2_02_FULL_44_16]OGQ47546.1 MAG: hypothetical protein A3I05_01950 [Deltaproteobacteria bacterium RIFCSPLOWO2_02_FULL_44_10]